jgi:hypothetical protein
MHEYMRLQRRATYPDAVAADAGACSITDKVDSQQRDTATITTPRAQPSRTGRLTLARITLNVVSHIECCDTRITSYDATNTQRQHDDNDDGGDGVTTKAAAGAPLKQQQHTREREREREREQQQRERATTERERER